MQKRGKGGIEKTLSVCLITLFVLALIFIFSLIKKPSLTGYTIFESQPNQTDGKDAYIRNQSSLNYGTDSVLKVGKTLAGAETRSLLEFNVSSIPASNTIVSAVIQLYVSTLNSANITIKAYRLTSSWNETSTTWNNRDESQLWWTGGGDYASTAIDTVVITSANQWYNFTITSTVKGWIDGTNSNLGIILIPATGTSDGTITEFFSSDYTTDTSLRPKITIDYTSNAPPTINSTSINSNLTNLKKFGENVTFNVSWSDPEGNNTQIFVCNSSSITTSGCGSGTFCNTSLASTNPSSCSYTIQSSDKRVTNVWIAVCDIGNCSSSNATSFNMNHEPVVFVVEPNGGETINQTSQGNYLVKFNVTDSDSDYLMSHLYYGTTQNSTSNTIASNLNLTTSCTDPDSNTSTTNLCTYSWNTTGISGRFFLTINVNDSYHIGNDSSNSAFNISSLIDNTAPNITAQWIENVRIYSGRNTQIYANVTEPNIDLVWVAINTTPQQNLTMSNSSGETFNATLIASTIGTYNFKVYARDIIGNLNDTLTPQNFNVTKPVASTQNFSVPSSSYPYATIKVTSQLNATDSLINVSAFLYTPEGFTFLNDYPQNTSIGNFSANQTRTAIWFLSTPLTQTNYILNATFTDNYSNTYNTSNINITVTLTADRYSASLEGYPEVETGGNYFAEVSFTNNGIAENAESSNIKIYDSVGSLIVGPVSMNNPGTGVYNYSYTVGSSVNEGQWKTTTNTTKNSVNYYANQFWKVIGGPFDVRDITIINSATNNLQISVITQNTGGVTKDITMRWNLTKESTQELIDTGSDTFAVNANSERTYTITPNAGGFTGQARITFLGYWSATEKAGAFKVFTITAGETTPSPTSSGGGGGVGGAVTAPVRKNYEFKITAPESITMTKNIKKTIEVEIENTGQDTLTNISLSLDGINKDYYSISPKTINKIKSSGKEKFFVEFSVSDFLGEIYFDYAVKSNELSKKASGKLVVLQIKEFFLKEIDRLKEEAQELKERTEDEKLINDIEVCKEIIINIKNSVDKEQFINARDEVKKTEECLEKIEKKIEKKPFAIPIPAITFPWVITWALILIIILLFIIAFYIIYKKFRIINLLKEKPSLKFKDIPKKKSFAGRIRDIEKKLED